MLLARLPSANCNPSSRFVSACIRVNPVIIFTLNCIEILLRWERRNTMESLSRTQQCDFANFRQRFVSWSYDCIAILFVRKEEKQKSLSRQRIYLAKTCVLSILKQTSYSLHMRPNKRFYTARVSDKLLYTLSYFTILCFFFFFLFNLVYVTS